jgi:lipopolysaccharide export system protein LptA
MTALSALLMANGAWGLDSDRDQPATLEANDFELDLKTGVRTYRGDVVYRQGSIRLDCDELVTYFNDDGELDKGVCSGDPGRFRQRPEGSEDDMIGEARVITMDQVEELVTLKSRAKATQGPNTISGRLITYNLATEKVIVQGEARTKAAPEVTATDGDTGSQDQGGESSAESAAPSRARLVIEPRKKKPEKADEGTKEEEAEKED